MTGKVVLITVTTCIIFIREAQTTANSASEVPIRNFFPVDAMIGIYALVSKVIARIPAVINRLTDDGYPV